MTLSVNFSELKHWGRRNIWVCVALIHLVFIYHNQSPSSWTNTTNVVNARVLSLGQQNVKTYSYRYLVEQMKKREGFHILGEVRNYLKHTEKGKLFFLCKFLITCVCVCLHGQPEFVNVCFWYIPPSLRGKEGNADYQDRLAKVNLYITSVIVSMFKHSNSTS